MKNVLLIFPDITSLTDFVLSYEVKNAEVNTLELSLTTTLNEDDIIVAVQEYDCVVKMNFETTFH